MSEQIDRYDQMILDILQHQGRITNQELAEAIKLSPSPCLRRVRQMEEDGLIEGYVALLNAKKLGLTLMAFIGISMDRHTPERFETLESTLAEYPEVLECHYTTGNWSILIKVLCRDNEHLMHLLNKKIQQIEGVSRTETFISLDQQIDRQISI